MLIPFYIRQAQIETLQAMPPDHRGLAGVLAAHRILDRETKNMILKYKKRRVDNLTIRGWLAEWWPIEYFSAFTVSVYEKKHEKFNALIEICEEHPEMILIPAFTTYEHLNNAKEDLVSKNYRYLLALHLEPTLYQITNYMLQNPLSLKEIPFSIMAQDVTTEKFAVQIKISSALEREFNKKLNP